MYPSIIPTLNPSNYVGGSPSLESTILPTIVPSTIPSTSPLTKPAATMETTTTIYPTTLATNETNGDSLIVTSVNNDNNNFINDT